MGLTPRYKDLVLKQMVFIEATKEALEIIGIDDDISNRIARISGFYQTGYIEVKIDKQTYDVRPNHISTIDGCKQ